MRRTCAVVDVWQTDMHSFYDVQQPGVQLAGNGHGLFTAGSDGDFVFPKVAPAPYPIPPTVRSGRCWTPPAGIRTVRLISASSWKPTATGRSPRTCSSRTAPT
ncbi:hypothetical protein GCM10022232_83140 [Streptomyces plumbiresistens]|uniref:Uncharacterized protein n=1 Tax=Streptomyces plumbiresistens TaxID=511811 RepID=A0ABP7TF77_9ACTN